MSNNRSILWLRWIAANGCSELVVLVATFATIGYLMIRIDVGHPAGILLSFAITVASGTIEATLVGSAQWWAMHAWFPRIGRMAWWRATLVGALFGYVLVYLPSTLMSMSFRMGKVAAHTLAFEPPLWTTLLQAAVLGAAAGALLSFAQWLVLRDRARQAGLWIPVNMLAWACGMPVIFRGMDLAFKQNEIWQFVLVVGGATLAAGLVVGAINGWFLVVLAGEKT